MPEFLDSTVLEISWGGIRWSKSFLKESLGLAVHAFVPNDCHLSSDRSDCSDNRSQHGGKSAIRQVAIITLMAQLDVAFPQIIRDGVVDRIFPELVQGMSWQRKLHIHGRNE